MGCIHGALQGLKFKFRIYLKYIKYANNQFFLFKVILKLPFKAQWMCVPHSTKFRGQVAILAGIIGVKMN